MFKKLTPILLVEVIEPCLPFWTERLGFEKTAEVPEGERLGFVILAKDGLELMIQSRESAQKDLQVAALAPGGALFFEIADLDALIRALAGAEVVVPRRTTFYGSEEIWVREPGGNLIGFAQFPAA